MATAFNLYRGKGLTSFHSVHNHFLLSVGEDQKLLLRIIPWIQHCRCRYRRLVSRNHFQLARVSQVEQRRDAVFVYEDRLGGGYFVDLYDRRARLGWLTIWNHLLLLQQLSEALKREQVDCRLLRHVANVCGPVLTPDQDIALNGRIRVLHPANRSCRRLQYIAALNRLLLKRLANVEDIDNHVRLPNGNVGRIERMRLTRRNIVL